MKTMEIARNRIPGINTDTILIHSIPTTGKSADKESEGKWVCSEPPIYSLKLIRHPADHFERDISLIAVLVLFVRVD